MRSDGELCSRKRVARIMKKYDIAAKMKRKFKVTTRTNPSAVPAPNLLQQSFIEQSQINGGLLTLPM